MESEKPQETQSTIKTVQSRGAKRMKFDRFFELVCDALDMEEDQAEIAMIELAKADAKLFDQAIGILEEDLAEAEEELEESENHRDLSQESLQFVLDVKKKVYPASI